MTSVEVILVPAVEWFTRREADFVADSPMFPTSRPPFAITALTTAAQGGGLWYVAAALMAVRPGRSRRAAITGAVAVASAGLVAHALGELLNRHRPRAEHLPAYRALPRKPTSPSMPSAHAAAATAFVVAVAQDRRSAASIAAPVAAVVAYSRIRTRAHWPSDIIGGMVVGALMGRLARCVSHRRTGG